MVIINYGKHKYRLLLHKELPIKVNVLDLKIIIEK